MSDGADQPQEQTTRAGQRSHETGGAHLVMAMAETTTMAIFLSLPFAKQTPRKNTRPNGTKNNIKGKLFISFLSLNRPQSNPLPPSPGTRLAATPARLQAALLHRLRRPGGSRRRLSWLWGVQTRRTPRRGLATQFGRETLHERGRIRQTRNRSCASAESSSPSVLGSPAFLCVLE